MASKVCQIAFARLPKEPIFPVSNNSLALFFLLFCFFCFFIFFKGSLFQFQRTPTMGSSKNPKKQTLSPSSSDPSTSSQMEQTPSLILAVHAFSQAQQAVVDAKSGKHEEALKLVIELCKLNSDSPFLYKNQAAISYICATTAKSSDSKHEYRRNAVECARRSVQLAPNSLAYTHYLAYILYRLSNNAHGLNEAIRECKRGLEIVNPDDQGEGNWKDKLVGLIELIELKLSEVKKKSASSQKDANLQKEKAQLIRLVDNCAKENSKDASQVIWKTKKKKENMQKGKAHLKQVVDNGPKENSVVTSDPSNLMETKKTKQGRTAVNQELDESYRKPLRQHNFEEFVQQRTDNDVNKTAKDHKSQPLRPGVQVLKTAQLRPEVISDLKKKQEVPELFNDVLEEMQKCMESFQKKEASKLVDLDCVQILLNVNAQLDEFVHTASEFLPSIKDVRREESV